MRPLVIVVCALATIPAAFADEAAPIAGSAVQVLPQGSSSVLVINRGTKHGVAKGQKGTVVGVDKELVITDVYELRSKGKIDVDATTLGANPAVTIYPAGVSPPAAGKSSKPPCVLEKAFGTIAGRVTGGASTWISLRFNDATLAMSGITMSPQDGKPFATVSLRWTATGLADTKSELNAGARPMRIKRVGILFERVDHTVTAGTQSFTRPSLTKFDGERKQREYTIDLGVEKLPEFLREADKAGTMTSTVADSKDKSLSFTMTVNTKGAGAALAALTKEAARLDAAFKAGTCAAAE